MGYNYNSNNNLDDIYNESNTAFPQESIILLVHGFMSNAYGMQKLIDNILSLGTFVDYYNFISIDTPISQFDDVINDVYVKINKAFASKPKTNLFVKVSFTNDECGTVDDQTEELFHIIHRLKKYYPNKKIITVGHSKGGVIAMNCAICHPKLIDKLVSIGTPYTTTILNHLVYFVKRIVETKLDKTINIIAKDNSVAQEFKTFALNFTSFTFESVVNAFVDKIISKKDLRDKWNRLSVKPKFTPIATRALVIDGEHESDVAVPVKSALAEGFLGKSLSDEELLVKNDSFKIELTTSLYVGEFNIFTVVHQMNSIIDTSSTIEGLDLIFSIIYSLFGRNSSNPYIRRNTAKYVHADMPCIRDYLGSSNESMNNPEVAIKVLAGLKD